MTAIPIAAGTRQAASLTAATTAVAVRLLRKYVRSPQLLVWSVAGGAIFIVLFPTSSAGRSGSAQRHTSTSSCPA
jgi:hypothetical protein